MDDFYRIVEKIIEFKFSIKINSSESLELGALILRYAKDNMINEETPKIDKCYHYSLMSVLKKMADKRDKKNYTLKLNGSEYNALCGVLEHYHTNLLGDSNEASSWVLTYDLLQKLA